MSKTQKKCRIAGCKRVGKPQGRKGYSSLCRVHYNKKSGADTAWYLPKSFYKDNWVLYSGMFEIHWKDSVAVAVKINGSEFKAVKKK